MLSIAGKTVGGMEVSVHSKRDVRAVQAETSGKCRFVVSCGCGFYREGSDGVELFGAALFHHRETGHKAFGHFDFGRRGER